MIDEKELKIITHNFDAWFSNGMIRNPGRTLYLTGKMHLKGEILKFDPAKAVNFLEQAVQADHIDAYIELGLIFANGIYDEKGKEFLKANHRLARVLFYLPASEYLNPYALLYLEILDQKYGKNNKLEPQDQEYINKLFKGKLAISDVRHFDHFNKSLNKECKGFIREYNNKNPDVLYCLGLMYEHAITVEKDEFKACKYYLAADKLGHQYALARAKPLIQKNKSKDKRTAEQALEKGQDTNKKPKKTHAHEADISLSRVAETNSVPLPKLNQQKLSVAPAKNNNKKNNPPKPVADFHSNNEQYNNVGAEEMSDIDDEFVNSKHHRKVNPFKKILSNKQKSDIGEAGEAYACDYLFKHYQKKYNCEPILTDDGFKVKGKNKHGQLKEVEIIWNNKHDNTYAPVDVIKKITRDGKVEANRYVEIKATKETQAKQGIAEISRNQLKCMRKYRKRFSIFRVYDVEGEQPTHVIYKDPYKTILNEMEKLPKRIHAISVKI